MNFYMPPHSLSSLKALWVSIKARRRLFFCPQLRMQKILKSAVSSEGKKHSSSGTKSTKRGAFPGVIQKIKKVKVTVQSKFCPFIHACNTQRLWSHFQIPCYWKQKWNKRRISSPTSIFWVLMLHTETLLNTHLAEKFNFLTISPAESFWSGPLLPREASWFLLISSMPRLLFHMMALSPTPKD